MSSPSPIRPPETGHEKIRYKKTLKSNSDCSENTEKIGENRGEDTTENPVLGGSMDLGDSDSNDALVIVDDPPLSDSGDWGDSSCDQRVGTNVESKPDDVQPVEDAASTEQDSIKGSKGIIFFLICCFIFLD